MAGRHTASDRAVQRGLARSLNSDNPLAAETHIFQRESKPGHGRAAGCGRPGRERARERERGREGEREGGREGEGRGLNSGADVEALFPSLGL